MPVPTDDAAEIARDLAARLPIPCDDGAGKGIADGTRRVPSCRRPDEPEAEPPDGEPGSPFDPQE